VSCQMCLTLPDIKPSGSFLVQCKSEHVTNVQVPRQTTCTCAGTCAWLIGCNYNVVAAASGHVLCSKVAVYKVAL
jgi:hypothetical protein